MNEQGHPTGSDGPADVGGVTTNYTDSPSAMLTLVDLALFHGWTTERALAWCYSDAGKQAQQALAGQTIGSVPLDALNLIGSPFGIWGMETARAIEAVQVAWLLELGWGHIVPARALADAIHRVRSTAWADDRFDGDLPDVPDNVEPSHG